PLSRKVPRWRLEALCRFRIRDGRTSRTSVTALAQAGRLPVRSRLRGGGAGGDPRGRGSVEPSVDGGFPGPAAPARAASAAAAGGSGGSGGGAGRDHGWAGAPRLRRCFLAPGGPGAARVPGAV